MKRIMDVFSLRTSAFQDERNRLSLLPTAVKLTHGNVSGAELLLRDAPTQAVLGSAGGCRMESGSATACATAGPAARCPS